MATVNFLRNVYKAEICLKNAYNQFGYIGHRPMCVAAHANLHEDPLLETAMPFEDIPNLPTLPLVGSAWVYFPIIGKYNLRKLHEADSHKNQMYGDIVRESVGPLNIVNVFVPEAQEQMARHEGKYPARMEFSTLKAYRESRPQWYKSTGIIILQGKEWYNLRFKAQKYIMKPKLIHAYLDPMQDVAKDFISLIRHKRDSSKEVENFMQDVYKWALESVSCIALDKRLGCLNPNLGADTDGMNMINSLNDQFYYLNKLEEFTGNYPFWKFLPSPTWNKFEKASDVFSKIVFNCINQSLEDLKKRTDDDELSLLQSLLMTKGLDLSGTMGFVADMFFAGIDATSHTVGFLLYNLAKNPDKQKILAEEVRQLLPNKSDRITTEVFNKLRYLKACLKESQRLKPIVRGNVRALDHDVVICGYRIPAGTIIFCMLQHIGRNEKFFKHPDKFMPERWMNTAGNEINPFAHAPFGIGIRSCIGRRFAELEVACLITEIIRNFNIEYHHEDIDMVTRLINCPDKPLRYSFLDR